MPVGVDLTRVLEVLDEAREKQITEGLRAAKEGHEIPERAPLAVLCYGITGNVQREGVVKGEAAAFWEGRRQRLKDAVNALGLVDPSAVRAPPPATPARQHTPVKPQRSNCPTPTLPDKKRKHPPTPVAPPAKKGHVSAPNTPRDEPRPASKDITTQQWQEMRKVMAVHQVKHDLGKDYTMPSSVPVTLFRIRKK